MEVVIAAVVGLVVGFGVAILIASSQSRRLREELANWRRRNGTLQEQFDAAKREREQVQKNVDSQLRTKDLQLKQLRDENEQLKQQPAAPQEIPTG